MNFNTTKDSLVYFDNAASTPLFGSVIEKYTESLMRYYPNPASSHKIGYALRKELEICKDHLLDLIGTSSDRADVVWTSGGTEANNLVIFGSKPPEIPTSNFSAVTIVSEHPSVIEPLKKLSGCAINTKIVGIDEYGEIKWDDFYEAIDDSTRLVCISLVQNETGVIHDLIRIRTMLDSKSPDAKLHVDATQAFGKVEVPWEKAKIDYLTLSGHKIHGPGGIGALICRNSSRNLQPIIMGGGQQNNVRSGSINLAGINALICASRTICKLRDEMREHILELQRNLCRGLLAINNDGKNSVRIKLNQSKNTSPFITNFLVPGYEGAVIMRMLGERNIIVGVGSACSSETDKPSRVLTAMGLSARQAYSAIRVSFGYQNSFEEVDYFISQLRIVINEY